MIGLITGTVLKIRAPAPSWFRCLVAVRKYSAMVGQNGVFNIKSCQQLRNGTMPEYIESPHSKLHNLIWRKSPENVYICKKPWNDDVTRAMLEFIHHVHDTYPAVNIIVTEEVAGELLQDSGEGGIQLGDGDGDGAGFSSARSSGGGPLPLYTGSIEEIVGKTDMIVSLGGDGTILRAVSAFLNFSQVPPVLSFALGTLGFLLPFDFSKYMETFRMVYESRGKVLHRSRLECHVVRKEEVIAEEGSVYNMVEKVQQLEDAANSMSTAMSMSASTSASEPVKCSLMHAMNDISLHRGLQPNLISLDIYIDNSLLTTSTADGVVFSTPTGSTAYSLSAGGSITHPLVPCILLTPICPRSLSFRPLILPLTSHIMIQMSEQNRNHSIKLNIDGIPQVDLRPGDQIHVISESGTIYVPGGERPTTLQQKEKKNHEKKSNPKKNYKGIWCVARSEVDWTKDINELLGFNSSFKANKQENL